MSSISKFFYICLVDFDFHFHSLDHRTKRNTIQHNSTQRNFSTVNWIWADDVKFATCRPSKFKFLFNRWQRISHKISYICRYINRYEWKEVKRSEVRALVSEKGGGGSKTDLYKINDCTFGEIRVAALTYICLANFQ